MTTKDDQANDQLLHMLFRLVALSGSIGFGIAIATGPVAGLSEFNVGLVAMVAPAAALVLTRTLIRAAERAASRGGARRE